MKTFKQARRIFMAESAQDDNSTRIAHAEIAAWHSRHQGIASVAGRTDLAQKHEQYANHHLAKVESKRYPSSPLMQHDVSDATLKEFHDKTANYHQHAQQNGRIYNKAWLKVHRSMAQHHKGAHDKVGTPNYLDHDQ